jgi:hypothetical protein
MTNNKEQPKLELKEGQAMKSPEALARSICKEQFESFEFLDSDDGDHFLCELQHKIAAAILKERQRAEVLEQKIKDLQDEIQRLS